MAGLVLEMRSGSAAAQDLPSYLDHFDTGHMGACVSVIVGWNRAGDKFQNMRGFHGAGGFEAINFASLLAGVPNQNDVCIWMVTGDDNRDYSAALRTKLASTLLAYNLTQVVQVRKYHGYPRVLIDRTGNVTTNPR